ncbi:MAG: hypothetical protein ABW104_15280 [Candidatus Thiodiazotropha sp. 6PLUC2]
MPHQTFPEDSTLKRHFESTVEMKRQRWLQLPPTDSILYRHTTMSGKNRSKSTSINTSTTTAVKSSAANASPMPQSVENIPPERGFLAKFFSLFSRSA